MSEEEIIVLIAKQIVKHKVKLTEERKKERGSRFTIDNLYGKISCLVDLLESIEIGDMT